MITVFKNIYDKALRWALDRVTPLEDVVDHVPNLIVEVVTPDVALCRQESIRLLCERPTDDAPIRKWLRSLPFRFESERDAVLFKTFRC